MIGIANYSFDQRVSITTHNRLGTADPVASVPESLCPRRGLVLRVFNDLDAVG